MGRFEIVMTEFTQYKAAPNINPSHMEVQILKDKITGVMYLLTNGGQAITPLLDSTGHVVADKL